MYTIVCSTESQKTVRPRKSAWNKTASACVWIALLVISGMMNPDSLKAQTSYGSVVGTIVD
jgi:hypothetical protein